MMNVRTEVANALYSAISIPPNRVTADVDDGVATLHGVVDWAYQKSHAEAIAHQVPGVTTVRNEISVNTEHAVGSSKAYH